jgi:hypothetical protein
MPVDQDYVPSALLQVQGGTDADHPRSKDEDIGPQFHHPALQKSNVARVCTLPKEKLTVAALPRKPGVLPRNPGYRHANPGYSDAETGLRVAQALGQHGSLKAVDSTSKKRQQPQRRS